MSQGWLFYRSYRIERSGTTGRYHWYCKDGSGDGWSNSRKAARKLAKTRCSDH